MHLNVILVLLVVQNSKSLNLKSLESLGISGDSYISDIAVYFNRAFLAIPRNICQNNISSPTLVELPWKEYNVILKSRFNKPLDNQLWAECDNLQNAISLAKETIKSKLWILDKGNKYCPAKLMAYSMLHNVFLDNDVIELAKVPKNRLTSLVIEKNNKFGNHRAFIANAGDNTILACYLNQLDCMHVKLLHQFAHISLEFLSISNSKLYVTGSKELQNESSISINAKFLGEKLGSSSGLQADLKDGLIYYLTRDYAVVRWINGESMDAEHHDVLAQSYKRMPYVSRLFSDPQGSVYALVNPFSPEKCVRESTFGNDSIEDDSVLERTVKIIKYNWVLDKFY
ncbi:unnamed protein product [Ceutorhynchus assimilis]|uniref:Uncharacterized protein n=1 Tax=Ceutorhynchus assimilis TaxID=467358 RepID=A0A9N9QP27_9CUCU|nr:unnamed protein product [Ceutorhynchus assimilis]